MEKFSQFRDKGSGISPFIPIATPVSFTTKFTHFGLFLLRLPFFLAFASTYFFFLQFLPLPILVRKGLLWSFMAIPGIWWVDLQLDGVRRGTLAEQPPNRFPHPGSVIAATLTSPIDAVYLAAIFDPIFTRSYPTTRQVERISLFGAIVLALSPVCLAPAPGARLTDLKALSRQYPNRVIAVFPEASSTNGKAVLPFTPSLLEAGPDTPLFPVSIRYTPGDVTTPVPGRWTKFLWDLLSRPTTTIRVRVAESVINSSKAATNGGAYSTGAEEGAARRRMGSDDDEDDEDDLPSVTPEEQRVLDKIAEALARLGRNKRVGLTLKDKLAFLDAWAKRKK
ncbi:acyltransferase [Plectosphaerella plurivora]|uniref:Acyltransferase n=1 Tax=Plectosphaerella plurivora TaxID=936078 RepID=A0A9P8VC98_9PEZI|nr:acyltransferase [Plectosphaerella plurivora]